MECECRYFLCSVSGTNGDHEASVLWMLLLSTDMGNSSKGGDERWVYMGLGETYQTTVGRIRLEQSNVVYNEICVSIHSSHYLAWTELKKTWWIPISEYRYWLRGLTKTWKTSLQLFRRREIKILRKRWLHGLAQDWFEALLCVEENLKIRKNLFYFHKL